MQEQKSQAINIYASENSSSNRIIISAVVTFEFFCVNFA